MALVRIGIALVLLAATLTFTVLMAQGSPESDVYLIVAHAPPFSRAELLAALEKTKNYTMWASWAGYVDIAGGSFRQAIERLVSSPEGLRERGRNVEVVVKKVGGVYRAELLRSGSVNMTYESVNLEDVLWWAANATREGDLIYGGWPLVEYKLDLPVFWAAYAIPFCNSTYYGPWSPPIKVAGDISVEARIFPRE